MSIEDLRDHGDDDRIAAPVCVVGAGAAGIALALALDRAGIDVCLLESGGPRPDAAVDGLGEIESVGLRRLSHTATRARGIGGTTALWTGRCGLLDPIDFARRPWIAGSGWPIDHTDLAPFVARAGQVLGLGPARYAGVRADEIVGPPAHQWDLRWFEPIGYQFSTHGGDVADTAQAAPVDPDDPLASLHHAGAPRATHVGEANLPALTASSRVRLLSHAHVTEILLDPAGSSVVGVRASSITGRRLQVDAPVVVLCTGGVDAPRLLLSSRSVHANGIGNGQDLVGRYLMDHPYTTIATYPRGAGHSLRRRLGHRWIDRGGARHVYSSALRLSPALQRDEGLLNGVAYVIERGDRPAPLRRARDAVVALRGSWDRAHLSEAGAVARRPDRLAWNAYERWVLRRPSLADPDLVEIDTMVEQLPDPASRITLSRTRDALGMEKAVVDWRAADLEYETTQRLAELLLGELRRLGYETPDRSARLDVGADRWRDDVYDSSHPMGATRMAADPRHGVVDRDLQVHGVAGLHIASGSVFATSGHINPTLTIVTLALRLAEHLRARAEARPPRVTGEAPRTRVGLVGVGERITSVHLPVIEALIDRYEIVGATSRSEASRGTFAARTGVPAFVAAEELVRTARPDLLVVAVTPEAVDGALPALVDLGVPLFLETPFAWDARDGRRTLAKIEAAALPVAVAEQTPFLPLEQLKQRVIALGHLGVVHEAHNDFARYDYHGVAALRAYLGGGREPVRVEAEEVGGARLGTITYDDGAVLLQHVGEPDGVRDARWSPSLRATGPRGSFVDDRLTVTDPSGAPVTTVVQRTEDSGRLVDLRVAVGDDEVVWRNPYRQHALTDEQIAVATLLDSLTSVLGTADEPLYRARDALIDSDVRSAMRYAALRGAPVRLPMRPSTERARALAHQVARRGRGSIGA
jgi:choline dehydrogenase-like flavoprotein